MTQHYLGTLDRPNYAGIACALVDTYKREYRSTNTADCVSYALDDLQTWTEGGQEIETPGVVGFLTRWVRNEHDAQALHQALDAYPEV